MNSYSTIPRFQVDLKKKYKTKTNKEINLLRISVDGEKELNSEVVIQKLFNYRRNYQSESLTFIERRLGLPHFYFINFINVSAVKMVLKLILIRKKMFIDNCNGVVMNGREFVAFFEANPKWDITTGATDSRNLLNLNGFL